MWETRCRSSWSLRSLRALVAETGTRDSQPFFFEAFDTSPLLQVGKIKESIVSRAFHLESTIKQHPHRQEDRVPFLKLAKFLSPNV